MDKDQYWKEKNARLRMQKMSRIIKEGRGTHRIRWEGVGEWAYDNEKEAQEDAERIERENPVVVRAWVEERDSNEP